MITQLPISTDSCLGFEVSGKVSLEQQQLWISSIEEILQTYEKVSVMVILGDQAGWGVKAGIEDLKWVLTHMDRLNKIAIVSDSHVWKWLVNLDSPFARIAGIRERHFDLSRKNEAWSWVNQES